MSKKINVIDLDNTLIPFDSFRRLIFIQILHFNIRILIISVLRIFRFITMSEFKKKIINALESRKVKKDIYIKISNIILNNLNKDIIALINKNSGEREIINILCTASPNLYVRFVADKLGWMGCGSGYYNGRFIHMYGINKLDFIKKKFPKEEYIYNYAISDSSSDLDFLKMFNKYHLFKK